MTAINEQNVMGTVFNPSLYRIELMELDTIKNGANTGEAMLKIVLVPDSFDWEAQNEQPHTIFLYDTKDNALKRCEKLKAVFDTWVGEGCKTTGDFAKYKGFLFEFKGKQITVETPGYQMSINGEWRPVKRTMRKFVALNKDGFCLENPYEAARRTLESLVKAGRAKWVALTTQVDEEDAEAMLADTMSAPAETPEQAKARKLAEYEKSLG